MKRFYETIFILRPTLNDQEISESIDSYRSLLQREGAEMLAEEDMGKKKLAYLIRNFQNGHYALFRYESESNAVQELERTFKISEDILRFLTIRLDPKKMPPPEAEKAVEPTVEDASAPAVEPAVEPAPEAGPDETPEPASEPVPEPVSEED